MRLLLAHAPNDAATAMIAALSTAGAVVDRVGTAAATIRQLSVTEYDAVVIDDGLPDSDGAETTRCIRLERFCAPVLVVTSSTDGYFRAKALRAGADDLLLKPYHADELLARVESITRRRPAMVRSMLRVGTLEIDIANRDVSANGRSICVTRNEFAILELLARRKGRLVSKQTILGSIYDGPGCPAGPRIIDVFICTLRKKLGTLGLTARIDTVRGQGYIMNDTVSAGQNALALAA